MLSIKEVDEGMYKCFKIFKTERGLNPLTQIMIVELLDKIRDELLRIDLINFQSKKREREEITTEEVELEEKLMLNRSIRANNPARYN